MTQFAEAALEAVRLYVNSPGMSPSDAWDQAASNVCGESTSSQKSCPRDAFLGLCEQGLVKGIPHGDYCNSKKNREYAISAVRLIKNNPTLAHQPKKVLWQLVLKGRSIVHNGQMDVVMALWNKGLITA